MMRGLKQSKEHKFKFYLRQCRMCDEIFKATSKKRKYCDDCKITINYNKIISSLKARGVNMVNVHIKSKEGINNDNYRLDSQSRNNN